MDIYVVLVALKRHTGSNEALAINPPTLVLMLLFGQEITLLKVLSAKAHYDYVKSSCPMKDLVFSCECSGVTIQNLKRGCLTVCSEEKEQED